MELASFSYFRIFELKKIIIKITFMPQYYICFNLYFWGLGIGDWAQSPIPNPQSPIPNPQLKK